MSKATNPFGSLTAVEATSAEASIVLSAEEYGKIRAAVHALQDATRDAEIAAARAKVAVGEAHAALTRDIRALAQKYPQIDPDATFSLGPARECSLVVGRA